MKDNAEQSNPSTGSVGEPAAWGVCWSHDVLDCEFVYEHRDNAKAVADEGNGSVVPLYRQPTPTLTDAEREAITEAREFYVGTRTGKALSSLLERMRATNKTDSYDK